MLERPQVPEDYLPLPVAARDFGMSENAVRLSARRRLIRAVTIRGRIHVYGPDLRALYQPRPYPPAA